MNGSRVYWLPVAVVLLAGVVSTFIWLAGTRPPEPGWLRLSAGLGAAMACTFANLAVRGLRWHFILRTIGVRLRARESALLFTALLPAILTPWALGEWLLAVFLRHRSARPLRAAGLAWLAARGTDALALILLMLLAPRGWLFPVLAGCAAATLLVAAVERHGPALTTAFRILLTTGLALFAWSLAGAGLAGVAHALRCDLSFHAAAALFAEATMGGGATGAPAGIAVTGASMIRGLVARGAPESLAAWIVAVARAGTVGFALLAGIGAIWLGRHRLRGILAGGAAGQGHFDELSESYADEIPAHIRDRLIETKSDVIARLLARRGIGPGARGVDVGCGQGWYLARLARLGFTMSGCDLTAGQVEQARAYCRAQGVEADVLTAPAERLPYPDASFDFAYAINVFHHITDPAARDQAFAEILRTLKAGAPFIVFEMNPINPLFRFYLSYVYPFVRAFDDGTECWLFPGRLPGVPGGAWDPETAFITFVPDFLPRALLRIAQPLEVRIERSRFRRFSAHFAAALIKTGPGHPP